LLSKSIASLHKGQRLPSATPSYYRSSFNRNGKKYVQIWFKLNSSLQNQDTYFTIFKGQVITKTRRQYKVKVYLNLKTHRIYYTDDHMKPKGRLVSAKIPKNAGLTKNWHYFYIDAEYLGDSETPKRPRFETCISVDGRPCKRVRSVANKDGWKKIKGRFMTDDLNKAVPVSSFNGLIYGAGICDR
jgi:ribosomal protein L21E